MNLTKKITGVYLSDVDKYKGWSILLFPSFFLAFIFGLIYDCMN